MAKCNQLTSLSFKGLKKYLGQCTPDTMLRRLIIARNTVHHFAVKCKAKTADTLRILATKTSITQTHNINNNNGQLMPKPKAACRVNWSDGRTQQQRKAITYRSRIDVEPDRLRLPAKSALQTIVQT